MLSQTLEEWNGIVVDSGRLFEEGVFVEFKDDRLLIEQSGEKPGDGVVRNQHSWLVNRLLCSGRLRGEIIFMLCCDDWFYPWAFQCAYDYWTGRNKEPQCMYASIHLGRSDASGNTEFVGERIADVPRGQFVKGPGLDCQVDYSQFIFTQQALAKYRELYGDEILSERLEDKGHADGLFMEKMGLLFPVERIGYFIGMNRRTPQSVNCGTR